MTLDFLGPPLWASWFHFVLGMLTNFGICFGHQIIAQALGGRVELKSTGIHAAACKFRLTPQGSLLLKVSTFAVMRENQSFAEGVYCRSNQLACQHCYTTIVILLPAYHLLSSIWVTLTTIPAMLLHTHTHVPPPPKYTSVWYCHISSIPRIWPCDGATTAVSAHTYWQWERRQYKRRWTEGVLFFSSGVTKYKSRNIKVIRPLRTDNCPYRYRFVPPKSSMDHI